MPEVAMAIFCGYEPESFLGTHMGGLAVDLKTMDKKKSSIAESLYRDGKTKVSEICKTLGISRATFL